MNHISHYLMRLVIVVLDSVSIAVLIQQCIYILLRKRSSVTVTPDIKGRGGVYLWSARMSQRSLSCICQCCPAKWFYSCWCRCVFTCFYLIRYGGSFQGIPVTACVLSSTCFAGCPHMGFSRVNTLQQWCFVWIKAVLYRCHP